MAATPVIESDAFLEALLQSQKLRIRTLIIAISALAVLAMLRELIEASQAPRGSIVSLYGVVAGLIGYEVLMLRLASRSVTQGRDLPHWFWICSVLIEVSLPSVIIVMLTERGPFGPYQALVSGLIAAEARRSTDEVIQRLHARVLSFVEGAPQDDHLTTVVIKRICPKSETGEPLPD